MTDRQRFETNALAHGATVLDGTDTQLVILATDGRMVTTYTFNENGSFKGISTKYREN
jgi:hypothetical protein